MTSITKIELNVCRAYMARIRQKFSVHTNESQSFLLILEIYEFHLIRKNTRRAATWDEMAALKQGVRVAEQFINILPTVSRHQELARELLDVLSDIVLDLTREIVANEELYPELKWAFDRERQRYRDRLNLSS